MIENEQQYRVTQHWIGEFEKTLEELRTRPRPEKVHPRIHTAMIESVESQLDDLREEVAAYEALKAQRVQELELRSLSELPDLFIKTRIARGLTQVERSEEPAPSGRISPKN